jgi:ribosomal protein S21
MVEFKRKKGETFESFLRRFNKRLQQSGDLMSARKNRYHRKDKNEHQKKTSALIGLELRHKKEYQRRTGKFKDEMMGRW